MASIVQQPDALSFSLNLKRFLISTSIAIPVILKMGETEIFNQTYAPGASDMIEIDLRKIVDKLLSVGIPVNNNILTEQVLAVADFTLNYDGADVPFRVVKGGVSELQSQAHDFLNANLLSWQPQIKKVLQYAPEWIGVYPTAESNIKVTAFFSDQSSEAVSLSTVTANKLWSVNSSWSTVNSLLTRKNPIAWDVVMESPEGQQLSYIQRYQLRNATSQESFYLWSNTLGGIDSVSLTGYLEDDKKLEHKISELNDDSLDEYWTDKNREIRQNTGYLTIDESRWMEDFFISPVRYRVREDGAIKRIVLTESKVISSSEDDLSEYEFTYRFAEDPALLNLDRTLDPLPEPEGLTDFFLIELLSGLTTALYADNLYFGVQSPYAQGWQKLSFAELWEQALPTLVDNSSIKFFDGKLRTNVGVVVESRKPKHGFESAQDAVLSFSDSTLEFTIKGKLVEDLPQDIRLWNMGNLLKKQEESIGIENTKGTWYIYYKDIEQPDKTIVNTLMATLTPWDRNKDLPIATIYWDEQVGVISDNRYVYTEVNHALLTRFQDLPHPALDIFTETIRFVDLLSDKETTVQKALERIDYLLKVTVLEFENSTAPSIENYDRDFAPRYGQNPNCRLVIYEGQNELPLYQAPIIYKTEGKISRIAWSLAETSFSGKIIISR